MECAAGDNSCLAKSGRDTLHAAFEFVLSKLPLDMLPAPLARALSSRPTLEFALAFFVLSIAFYLFTLTLRSAPLPKLRPDEYESFRLVRKEELTPTVRRYVFGLRDPKERPNLPIGHHVSLKYVDEDGKDVVRSYTPVSGPESPGVVSLVVKVYNPDASTSYPGGAMSFFLDNMIPGDSILMRGPKGTMTYEGCGRFVVHKTSKKAEERREAKHIVLLCGGTGITPMLRVARGELDKLDKQGTKGKNKATTKKVGDEGEGANVTLLFANSTDGDVPLKPEFDRLQEEHPDRFKVVYIASKVEGGERGEDRVKAWKDNGKNEIGRLSVDMLKRHVPTTNPTQFLICGPPGFVKALLENLKAMGYDESSWFIF